MNSVNAIEYLNWGWRGYRIPYQQAGETGPAVVLIHGFGASGGHWRKNLPVLGEGCRVFAIDLIGFGGSDKPAADQIAYTFETWAQQVGDFCEQVVGEPVFLVANSIGCVVAMQTAVDFPEQVLAVALLNCSLRLLHERKRVSLPLYRQWGASIAQNVLSVKALQELFFKQLAKPATVRKILLQAYGRDEAVTDELVEMILEPARSQGAVGVFIAFTGYAQGPLPEDLLPILPCKALILWGTEDPWEPVALGREFAKYQCVEKFIELPGVGHCPQDEAPELVNPILQQWIFGHSNFQPTIAI